MPNSPCNSCDGKFVSRPLAKEAAQHRDGPMSNESDICKSFSQIVTNIRQPSKEGRIVSGSRPSVAKVL
ncbi:hypothetical protein [Zavarzinella formosa]|uniref:hypothetical protein n=1 Tax=Zavarzinella formosa TaxID=360055 RepID=UPI0002D8B46B|nr:hypothetical protein [Zavarzinella formosa]